MPAIRHEQRQRNLDVPIFIFCYHKAGSAFFGGIFRDLSKVNGWKFQHLLGMRKQAPVHCDVVFFCHSLFDHALFELPFRGVRMIRDPRDIIVSGYLYHRRTTEKWCVHTELNPDPPVRFPKVPRSQQHHDEVWKTRYLESLNNMSYQQNLLTLSQDDGLMFEMEHYGAWTIENMLTWPGGRDDVLELKYEDLMNDYNGTFQAIFQYLDFTEPQMRSAMHVASLYDISSKSDRQLEKMEHVSSRQASKWRDYFTERHKQAFRERFGDVLIQMGYEKDDQW